MAGPYARPPQGSKKAPDGGCSLLSCHRVPGLARGATKHVLGEPLPAGAARESHHRLTQGGEDVAVFGAQLFRTVLSEQQRAKLLAGFPKPRHPLPRFSHLANAGPPKPSPRG